MKPKLTQKRLSKFVEQLKQRADWSMEIRPLPDLIEDKEAIRAALKESRKRHTKRVRSNLP